MLSELGGHGIDPPLSAGVGVEPPTKFSKNWCLTGSYFQRGVAGKEGVTYFRGIAIFR